MPGPVQEHIVPQPLTFLEKYGISPVLFAFLVLVVIFFLFQIVGGVIGYVLFGANPTPENVVGFRLLTGLSELTFLLLPTLLLVRLATFSPLEYLRIRPPDMRTLLPSVVGIFSLQQMLQIYLVFQDKIPIPRELQSVVHEYKKLIE